MPAVGLAVETNVALYVPRLSLLPEANGYMVTEGESAIVLETQGGSPRSRRDLSGTSASVDVVWVLNRSDYNTLMDFYDRFYYQTFRLSLLIDSYELTEHDVNFVPGTFSLAEQSGDSYTVSARLEVQLLPKNEDYDLGLIAIYGSYQEGSLAFMEQLAIFANTTLEANL